MTLDQFLLRYKISTAEFAPLVGYSIHAVRKWRQGSRIPRSQAMYRILAATNGKVRPSEWYDPPKNR